MEANTKTKLEKMLRSAVAGILANPDSNEAIVAFRQFAKGAAKEIEPTNISFYDGGKSEFQAGADAIRAKMRAEEALRSINETNTALNDTISAIRKNGVGKPKAAPRDKNAPKPLSQRELVMLLVTEAGKNGITREQAKANWTGEPIVFQKRWSELVTFNLAFTVGDRVVDVKFRDAYPTEFEQHKQARGF